MSASDRRLGAALVIAGTMAFAACDDPTRALDAPPANALHLLLVLDPDSGSQPLQVHHAGRAELRSVRATLVGDEGGVAGTESDDSFGPCHDRYGTLVGPLECIELAAKPRFGATYELSVSADGVPTATATTTVPGDFEIVSLTTNGNPPGAVELSATWRKSAGTFRYVVAIRSVRHSNCYPDTACYDRWFAVTTDTTVRARLEAHQFDSTRAPYYLDVYAMNRNVYEIVMTGSGSEFFPVPPGQNVRGGYGGVGAWVIRSLPLP